MRFFFYFHIAWMLWLLFRQKILNVEYNVTTITLAETTNQLWSDAHLCTGQEVYWRGEERERERSVGWEELGGERSETGGCRWRGWRHTCSTCKLLCTREYSTPKLDSPSFFFFKVYLIFAIYLPLENQRHRTLGCGECCKQFRWALICKLKGGPSTAKQSYLPVKCTIILFR